MDEPKDSLQNNVFVAILVAVVDDDIVTEFFRWRSKNYPQTQIIPNTTPPKIAINPRFMTEAWMGEDPSFRPGNRGGVFVEEDMRVVVEDVGQMEAEGQDEAWVLEAWVLEAWVLNERRIELDEFNKKDIGGMLGERSRAVEYEELASVLKSNTPPLTPPSGEIFSVWLRARILKAPRVAEEWMSLHQCIH